MRFVSWLSNSRKKINRQEEARQPLAIALDRCYRSHSTTIEQVVSTNQPHRWEPESNLNPKLIKKVARTILELAQSGIQVFVATHSLFLLRELYILQRREFQHVGTRYFGLHIGHEGGVSVEQGDTMDDVGSIAALDEDLQQPERYVDTEMGVPLSPSTGFWRRVSARCPRSTSTPFSSHSSPRWRLSVTTPGNTMLQSGIGPVSRGPLISSQSNPPNLRLLPG
jgi:hypothetical protein